MTDNNQNNSQPKSRKVLGLKTELNLSNVGRLADIGSAKKQQVTHHKMGSKVPVVVITKGKNKGNNRPQDMLGSLTEQEKSSRLTALKLAEQQSNTSNEPQKDKVFEEAESEIIISDYKESGEKILEDLKVNSDNQEELNENSTLDQEMISDIKQEEYNGESENIEEVTQIIETAVNLVENTADSETLVIIEEKKEKLTEESIKSLKDRPNLQNKGRVRNLDQLYRKQINVEEVVAEADDKQSEDSAAINQKNKSDSDEAKKPNTNFSKSKQITRENSGLEVGKNKKPDSYLDTEDNVAALAQGKKTPPKQRQEASRKLTASQLLMIDSEDAETASKRKYLGTAPKQQRYNSSKKRNKSSHNLAISTEKVTKEVIIPDFITVQELSSRMAEKASNVLKSLIKLGVMVTINQFIDSDTAELIVNEFGHKAKRFNSEDWIKKLTEDTEDDEITLQWRAPIVTVMGHVDHGKTSLLDALRSTDVAAGESGGITQHIGAHKIHLKNDKSITFLDTPGHEAFTAMRMRGAQVTDIVVLVVAADDGIKAQTIEAIHHAKAANVPIVVAVNKIDKPNANFEYVKNALLSHELVPDDMGGDVMVIQVSAKQKIGLEKLEEAIILQADFLNLQSNYQRNARGRVIEAKVDKAKGGVVTFLVQKGTLKTGDLVVAGSAYGRVRFMHDDKGNIIKEACPSTPIEVFGLSGNPQAGDEFIVLKDEKMAKDLAEFRLQQEKERKIVASTRKISVDQMFSQAKSGVKELAIIIKADVHGSAEAIVHSLNKFSNNEVVLKILHYGVGGITESDVTLAAASKALVMGFNVRANSNAKEMAKSSGIDVRYYSIIYNLLDDIKVAMTGLLTPLTKEKILGYTEIRKVFDLSKFGKIAGCYVTEGLVKRGAHIRLLRDNIVIYEGKLKSLKRQKEDVREVKEGFECGIALENFEDIKERDVVEAFEIIEESRKLELI